MALWLVLVLVGCSILSVTIIEMMALPQPSTILFLCSNELWFWFNLKTCWILVIFTRGYNLQLEVYFSTKINVLFNELHIPPTSQARIRSNQCQNLKAQTEPTSWPAHVSGLSFEPWHNWISFTLYVGVVTFILLNWNHSAVSLCPRQFG